VIWLAVSSFEAAERRDRFRETSRDERMDHCRRYPRRVPKIFSHAWLDPPPPRGMQIDPRQIESHSSFRFGSIRDVDRNFPKIFRRAMRRGSKRLPETARPSNGTGSLARNSRSRGYPRADSARDLRSSNHSPRLSVTEADQKRCQKLLAFRITPRAMPASIRKRSQLDRLRLGIWF